MFGGRVGNDLADRLLAYMRAAGADGITRGELRDRVSHDMSTERFDVALAHIERCLQAFREREGTAGRPRERWVAQPGGKPVEREESELTQPFIPTNALSSRLRQNEKPNANVRPDDAEGAER